MAVQDFQVNYTINVDASEGTGQVREFAKAVAELNAAKTTFDPAVEQISKFMKNMEAVFRPNGKKRDYNFKMEINTSESEKRLGRVLGQIEKIKTEVKGIKLDIAAPPAAQATKAVKENASAYQKKVTEARNTDVKKTAATSVQSALDAQKNITKVIGKVKAGLLQLEKPHKVNIDTKVAKRRLKEILELLTQINNASRTVRALGIGTPALQRMMRPPFALPQSAQRQLVGAGLLPGRTVTSRAVSTPKEPATPKPAVTKPRTVPAAIQPFVQQQAGQTSIQRAAINRLQYMRRPSMRSLPFMSMFNAYMAYGFLKSELTKAIEYHNIMTSAQSILRVADTDLSTFETRFEKMSRNVRQIGLDTKFTAVEIAGATKYLAMAGMNVDMINKSIRPITNLALIGDNDVAQIADLVTNIMAGYNVKGESMDSVADILASTVSRSNVNIVEMSESFKMAAGYMKLAGVDFTETSAAIGILGNAGIKGTMAGTSLRAMSTRFAKPTKEARDTLDRLNVRFTHFVDMYGKQVEQLRPLADIFEDLKTKGASMADMQAIFGRIGGNGAMMLLNNYEQLRTLSSQNRASYGVSSQLAEVKQNTTKGLWAKVTSQLTETFMGGYEMIEPVIRSTLRDFLAKFNDKEFTRGIASIGQSLINLFSVLGNIATWFARNYSWLEPLIFTGFIATKLFKLAGAVTNLGVAMGFLGKQSVASNGLQLIGNLVGLGGGAGKAALSFAQKRTLVTALSAAGISGKGAMTNALATMGMGTAARGATGLFASQVSTGGGLVGAGASIAAIGTGAVAATAGIAALVGALGWVAYKFWKVKEANDAVMEELTANEKFHYPSIDALYSSLDAACKKAREMKSAIDDATSNKTLEDASGLKIGGFSMNNLKVWGSALAHSGGSYGMAYNTTPMYTFAEARQDDIRDAILVLARKEGQSRINSAWQEFGKMSDPLHVSAFISNIAARYGQDTTKLDTSLYTVGANRTVTYDRKLGDKPMSAAYNTPDFANYQNTKTVTAISSGAEAYMNAISTTAGAREMLEHAGVDFKWLTDNGFYEDATGTWRQKALGKNATDQQRVEQYAASQTLHTELARVVSTLQHTLGESAEAAENVMKKAGFSPHHYSNEPEFKDTEPFNANRITTGPGGDDDGGAGGNYSGTGKLSSAAPKQVIVNITNLLSLEAINLLKSGEGRAPEVQDLKEQLAQALIDVVHDFDASWNG